MLTPKAACTGLLTAPGDAVAKSIAEGEGRACGREEQGHAGVGVSFLILRRCQNDRLARLACVFRIQRLERHTQTNRYTRTWKHLHNTRSSIVFALYCW